jgi:hypothetical protein
MRYSSYRDRGFEMEGSMNIISTALISAVTSVLVVVISHMLSVRGEIKKAERVERQSVNSKYLNPLRLYLVENHFRLSEILSRATESGQCKDLLTVDSSADVSAKDAEWYNGWGTYLISSVYLTACLFAWMKKVRDNSPYLRLETSDDTRLTALMLRVSVAFLRGLGIYYVIQPSIGQDMILLSEDRLRSFREFCELLRMPTRRVWMDRLIAYYLETGRGQKLERVADAIAAIETLSSFLDKAVGGGESVKSRLEAEGISSL